MTKVTYDIVLDKDMANYMAQTLRIAGIDVKINESKPFYDSILGDIDCMLRYEILLSTNNFEQADAILIQALKSENYGAEHIFNGYSNEELMAIADNPDKHSRLDVFAAAIILENRGAQIPKPHVIGSFDPADEASTTDVYWSLPVWSRILVAVATLSGLGIILPGMGGTVMGLLLCQMRRHNSKGEMHFAFDNSTRQFGWALATISTVVFLAIWLLLARPNLGFLF
ncbi:MAG: hypothetical protein EAY75_03370 [Bacteroidetes bacterium]|nr:MAG: hypothetical protein EAY75_03370 [Bacteroidota bacterium]